MCDTKNCTDFKIVVNLIADKKVFKQNLQKLSPLRNFLQNLPFGTCTLHPDFSRWRPLSLLQLCKYFFLYIDNTYVNLQTCTFPCKFPEISPPFAASGTPFAATYPSANVFPAFPYTPRYPYQFSTLYLPSFFCPKIYKFDRPPTHVAASAPSVNRDFDLPTPIEPFPGKILLLPFHVRTLVAGS